MTVERFIKEGIMFLLCACSVVLCVSVVNLCREYFTTEAQSATEIELRATTHNKGSAAVQESNRRYVLYQ